MKKIEITILLSVLLIIGDSCSGNIHQQNIAVFERLNNPNITKVYKNITHENQFCSKGIIEDPLENILSYLGIHNDPSKKTFFIDGNRYKLRSIGTGRKISTNEIDYKCLMDNTNVYSHKHDFLNISPISSLLLKHKDELEGLKRKYFCFGRKFYTNEKLKLQNKQQKEIQILKSNELWINKTKKLQTNSFIKNSREKMCFFTSELVRKNMLNDLEETWRIRNRIFKIKQRLKNIESYFKNSEIKQAGLKARITQLQSTTQQETSQLENLKIELEDLERFDVEEQMILENEVFLLQEELEQLDRDLQFRQLERVMTHERETVLATINDNESSCNNSNSNNTN